MSNLRLLSSEHDPEALIATVRGVTHYENRCLRRGEKTAATIRMAAARRARIMARHGLSPEDWDEYQRVRKTYVMPPAQAAGVVRNSKRGRS